MAFTHERDGLPPRGHIPELDGVRGVAIGGVLYCHYFASQRHPGAGSFVRTFERLGTFAWTGVDLFFVLSGFLLGGILIDNRGAQNLLRVFYARRAARIFPLYYAWLLIFIVSRGLFPGSLPWLFSGALPAWQYAVYAQNIGYALRGDWGTAWTDPTWSLAIEEQFYLLLPLTVLLLPPRRLASAAVVAILSAPALRWALAAHPVAVWTLLPTRWDSLFSGVLGACLVRRPEVARALRRRPALIHAPLLACAAVWAAAIAWPEAFGPMVRTLFLFTLAAATSLLFILAALHAPWRGVLRARWLTWLGSVAYCVYLFHQVTAGLVFGFFGYWKPQSLSAADAGLELLSLGLTLGLAWLSYRYLESPFLRLGQRARYIRVG
jgi:peptidoglycan/LPS O-acetylase OafA/YrhL